MTLGEATYPRSLVSSSANRKLVTMIAMVSQGCRRLKRGSECGIALPTRKCTDGRRLPLFITVIFVVLVIVILIMRKEQKFTQRALLVHSETPV